MAEVDSPLDQIQSLNPDRMTQQVDHEGAPRLAFPVVGIGASAGGLEAFMELFNAMPSDTGMAFVLIQHLPPERESMVASILGGRTSLPVIQVEDQMKVQPNHVYIIRPGRTMTIRNGQLHLGEPVEKPGHRRPIDDFFRSLAEEQRERAICVLMSGMGSNGTAGAQSIKAVGGLCIAQDPDTAKFSAMPRSAIDAGFADFVLQPGEIPQLLLRYSHHPYASGASTPDANTEAENQASNEIISVVKARARLDFTGYKRPTVVRRIQRRMGINQCNTMADYARLLRQTPLEVSTLADDLMIHVTGFFRDPDVWEALKERVVRPLMAERSPDSPVRAWVTACSTGEEAYTLAMLLVEVAEEAGKRFEIKVFATDTAERSLGHARSGMYPGGIESELSAQRLDRFFERDNGSYQVKKELRELVVFAPQNVLQDPPFSRLDICTCRNLLIYLQPEMQQRVLALLHFGLREGGALLLGSSETISGSEELFEIIDKKHRLFRRIGPTRHGGVQFPLLASLERDREPGRTLPSRAGVAQITHRALLDHYGPPSVAIDRDMRIIYFHGNTEKFLDQPRGEPTRDLLTLVREPFRAAVRNALQCALTHNESSDNRDGCVQTTHGLKRVEIKIRPLDSRPVPTLFLAAFEEIPEAPPNSVPAKPEMVPSLGLEAELSRIRDELQSTVEELQASNEEMKASNEEATSVNEELQSTNEELETSKEELQSLNEELATVNSQLQAKMEELEATSNDLGSLLSSTSIAVIFLDTRFRIRRFTPMVRDLIELIPSDVGRPLRDLAPKFDDPQLIDDSRIVLERLVPIEKEINSQDNRVYLRRALPYRTADNRIDGVVITFFEITDRKKTENSLRESEEQHRLIIQGIQEYTIFMLDCAGKILTWNLSAEQMLGYSARDAIGQPLSLIVTPEDRATKMAERHLKEAEETGSAKEEHWTMRRDGTRFWGSGILSSLKAPNGELRGFVKLLRDNTSRKLTEEQLKRAKLAAEEANQAKDEFLANVSHELRTPLSALLLWAKIIEESDPSEQTRIHGGIDVINRSVIELQGLIEDLVDVSRIATGKLRIEPQPAMLASVIQAAIEGVRHAAAAKSHTFEADLDPALGASNVDPVRLQQAISNLLTNAIKFTPAKGRITFSAQRRGHEVEIQITDSGQGIAPEFLPHVFDRFRQASEATTRSTSGLGLGLTIAKQLFELHGGTIKAESAGKGKGATFTVNLPLPLIDPKAVQARSKEPSTHDTLSLKGIRILLVEDSANTRDGLAAILRKTGAEVTPSSDAAQAFTEYKRQRPDVLLSDLGLPDVDGHALLSQIRTWEKSRGLAPLPSVALTAYADEKNRQKALDIGFNRTLTKPVNPEHLVATIANIELAPSKAIKPPETT